MSKKDLTEALRKEVRDKNYADISTGAAEAYGVTQSLFNKVVESLCDDEGYFAVTLNSVGGRLVRMLTKPAPEGNE